MFMWLSYPFSWCSIQFHWYIIHLITCIEILIAVMTIIFIDRSFHVHVAYWFCIIPSTLASLINILS